ncbi:hypothetical protein DSM104329_01089 [Capillimicrobium parvum]|uniref:Uncharacterized protein n=1 Tax=Capillimicrobium parvum TaxID=2884022 RepID=A0A9E7BZP3_9ACTN|nr:hypothetical protein DSM104329_01089 [Capillimicrobium parvum]
MQISSLSLDGNAARAAGMMAERLSFPDDEEQRATAT